jgi:PAS domain S-box-containing protein
MSTTPACVLEKPAAEGEALHAAFFDASPHPGWICDLDTLALLAVNGSAIRRYGYSREEFLRMRLGDLHAPHDVHGTQHILAGADDPSGPVIPCCHRKKSGAMIILGIVASACEFGGKRLALLFAIDVTEGQRSEFLYRYVLDSIPLSVLLIDKSLRVVKVNRNFLEKSRRTKVSTLGRPLHEVFPNIILEELPLLQQIDQVFESGHALADQRLTYRAPGLPLRTYYYSIMPIAAGTPGGLAMLLMQDVTEQLRLAEEVRRVERHLASVAESASEILLSTDINGRILTWNNAAERISGYVLREVQGQLLFDYCAEEYREILRALFANLDSECWDAKLEYSLVTRGGMHIPAAWAFSRMKDDYGSTVGVVAVGRDLTERRKFEQQLLQSQKLAALGVMASGIAHEIRTPLAISYSAAQFLMEDDITEQFRKECAGKVHVGIRRASGIIENLLSFAHPSSRPAMVEFDLLSALREAIALAANLARIQRVEIVCNAPEGKLTVRGIAGLLEQVFLNLFQNAFTAMPDGGCLTITVISEATFVRVRVSDTGCGIAESDLYSIFDPFYTTAPVGKGIGLGLSICYSIVSDHGGSIEVESAPRQGSTFTVRLPVLLQGDAASLAGVSHAR